MKFSPIFLFLFLLVLTPMVLAQPPSSFPAVQFTEGFAIEFTQVPAYEFNRDLTFNTHVFNLSNGVRIDNSSTDCNYHLFDNRGAIVLNQQPMVFDVLGLDFEIVVNQNNFTRLGEYSYLVVCNDSTNDLGGLVSVGFELTADGKPSRPFPIQFSLILFSFLSIGVGLVKERFRFFQYMGSILMMILGVLTLFPGYSFINWTTLTGLSLGTILIGMGFYFLLEPAFSREEQEEHFDQGSEGGGG